MIPHVFGQSAPWSLGLEEELFSIDPASLDPVPFPVDGFDGVRLKVELLASCVEVATGVCTSVEEAVAELAELRAEAKRRAAAAGAVVGAAGTWPTAVPEEQEVTPEPGYLQFAEHGGPSVRRQHVAGLHVHVGVASPEDCLARVEAVLPWLPLVLAVSANSPYLEGEETGLASTRAEILSLLPRSGAPPAFSAYEDWERFAERLVELGLADTYTRIWWDVRPQPRYGTIEVRMPDQPTRLETTAAIAALVQGLVAAAELGPPADRGLYAQNRWAALRFGAAAELVHPDGSRLVGVPELLAELLERLEPVTRRLGSGDLLAPLAGLAQADEQLALGRGAGVRSLCERLLALT